MSEPYLAEIRIFGGNFAIRGWATCDGQLLPIAQNTALFSLLGTTYGGDGRTTFQLPDMRGRAPMNWGQGPGLSNYQIGQRAGDERVQLNATHMPTHSHKLFATRAGASTAAPSGKMLAATEQNTYASGGNPIPMRDGTMSTVGTTHNNMQPYLAVYFLIALQGLFPSRN